MTEPATKQVTAMLHVPADQQFTTLWSRDMIVDVEGLLTAASRVGSFGRVQCEAAIQSVRS